jgi:hypothetical protein
VGEVDGGEALAALREHGPIAAEAGETRGLEWPAGAVVVLRGALVDAAGVRANPRGAVAEPTGDGGVFGGRERCEDRRASVPSATSAKCTGSITPMLRPVLRPLMACEERRCGFIFVAGSTNPARRGSTAAAA